MKVIAINGKARSGKDTVADYLCQKYGFVKISLADEIKRICMRVYNFSEEQLWGEALKEEIDPNWGVTPRHAMQIIGTEMGRSIHRQTWLRFTWRMIEGVTDYVYERKYGLTQESITAVNGVVIPDVRFENELNFFAERKALLLRTKRNSDKLSSDAKAHVSEIEQERIPDTRFHCVFNNHGTLAELYQSIDVFMAGVNEQKL